MIMFDDIGFKTICLTFQRIYVILKLKLMSVSSGGDRSPEDRNTSLAFFVFMAVGKIYDIQCLPNLHIHIITFPHKTILYIQSKTQERRGGFEQRE